MSTVSVTDDQFLKARVKLRQWASGHRAGSDAVLLAATIPPDLRGLVIDAGSASGAVGLMAAWRTPHAKIKLVDVNSEELQLADDNIKANGFESRISICVADLFSSHAERDALGLCQSDADLVLSNPPYLDEGQARVSPDEDRARAHVMPDGGLEKWILACLQMLKPNGILTMIHRADQLDQILHHMKGRFGDLVILPIHSRAHEAATRVLISGKRNSRALMRVLPNLVIHQDEGGFTPRAAAIHSGDALISLRQD